MEWQPIETAPKDRYVIVYPPTWTGVISCAKWDADEHRKNPRPFWKRVDAIGISQSKDKIPTHWMPILEPPK